MTSSVLVFNLSAIDTYGMTVSSTYAVELPNKLDRSKWEKNFKTFEEWRIAKLEFNNLAKSKLEAKGPELFTELVGRGWRFEATIKSSPSIIKI